MVLDCPMHDCYARRSGESAVEIANNNVFTLDRDFTHRRTMMGCASQRRKQLMLRRIKGLTNGKMKAAQMKFHRAPYAGREQRVLRKQCRGKVCHAVAFAACGRSPAQMNIKSIPTALCPRFCDHQIRAAIPTL